MRWRGLIWLAGRQLAANKARAFVTVVVTGVVIAIAALALGVSARLERDLAPRIDSLFPERRLLVRARTADVAFVRLGTTRINPDRIAQVEALPGVERVLVQRSATFPVSARFAIPGTATVFATDVILHGVPRELIASDLALPGMPFSFTGAPREVVPVLVSSFFLDVYNLGMADGAGLPRLSPLAAIGRTFDLVLGESSVGLAEHGGEPRIVTCRIVGLTPHPNLLGVIAPEDALLAWNAAYGPPQAARDASALHVDAASVAALPALQEALRGMGLEATAAADQAGRHRAVLSGVRTGLMAAALVVLLLGGVATTSLAVGALRERRAVLALHRVTGLTPGGALRIAAVEALVLGAASGVLGLAGAQGLALALERIRERLGAELSLVPPDLLRVGVEEVLVAALLALLLVVALPVLGTVWAVRCPALEELRRNG